MEPTTEDVLIRHARQYPRMAPCDAVKLLYQNEFGGGHLIDRPDRSLERLRTEFASVPRDPAAPCFEFIGNGTVRVMLGALDPARYSLEQLNRDFVRSARLRTGSVSAFRQKLAHLKALAGRDLFGFSAGELDAYLTAYMARGCPAPSHSAAYRAAYRPAYRVIRAETSLPLFLRAANRLAQRQSPVVIALDGRCASGKTTLARQLHTQYGFCAVHLDHFFLRPEQRTPERYAEPGGNLDRERFLSEVLLPLRRGEAPAYRPFDCRTQRLAETVQVEPARVVLAEGSYACHPDLRPYYDLCAFLTVDPACQLARIRARNGPACAEVFRRRWIPLEERYFSAFQIPDQCQFQLELQPRPADAEANF